MENKKTFEQSIQRLNEIVDELEKNEKPLDETIKLFEEGLKLVKTCNTKLTQFEMKVADIVKQNSGDQNEN